MPFRDFETKIHEARHGGQHARGEINALNFQGYGVMDEVDSYRAQYSWRGVYHYFYDDTSEWAVMNRIYRGLNPLVGTIIIFETLRMHLLIIYMRMVHICILQKI